MVAYTSPFSNCALHSSNLCLCHMIADVWALGCVFAEMLLGEPLFKGETTLDQLSLMDHFVGPLPQRLLNVKTTCSSRMVDRRGFNLKRAPGFHQCSALEQR